MPLFFSDWSVSLTLKGEIEELIGAQRWWKTAPWGFVSTHCSPFPHPFPPPHGPHNRTPERWMAARLPAASLHWSALRTEAQQHGRRPGRLCSSDAGSICTTLRPNPYGFTRTGARPRFLLPERKPGCSSGGSSVRHVSKLCNVTQQCNKHAKWLPRQSKKGRADPQLSGNLTRRR